VSTPSDERNEMNDGHSEQCDRLTGTVSIGHGSPTLRWRTATPRFDAARDGRSRSGRSVPDHGGTAP
jgi:hypothetical protein